MSVKAGGAYGYPENVKPEDAGYYDNVAQPGSGLSPVKILTASDDRPMPLIIAPTVSQQISPQLSPQRPPPREVMSTPALVAEAVEVVRRSSAPPPSQGKSEDDLRVFTAQDQEEEALAAQQPGLVPRPVGATARLVTGSYQMWGEKKSYHKRWVSQDASLVVQMAESRLLVAVFDGHGEGGHHVAGQVKRIFEQQAASIAADASGPAMGMHRVFAICQATLEQQEDLCRYSGCTASVALIDPNAQTVTAAHVGDSTLVVARRGAVVWGTEDHKVDAEAERRVLCHGGEVREAAVRGSTVCVRRVFAKSSEFPGLAMSRALGDLEAHRLGVSAEPEVVTMAFDPDSALVVASDGLWDVMSREVVAARATSAAEPDVVARSLVVDARALYPSGGDVDDITAVVVLPRAANPRSNANPGLAAEGPRSAGGGSPASNVSAGG